MTEHPENLRFTCSGCGDCCRGTNVPLVGGDLARLEALDWSGRVERLQGPARAVKLTAPQEGVTHRLERGEDGACAYLAEDAACLVHRHFGAEAKPLACRLYPFLLRPVGGALAVDVAFSCRAVSLRQGEPLATHESEWESLATEIGPQPEPRHHLRPKTPLGGTLLRELEGRLESFLRDESLDFFQRVRCCLDFARLATTGDPATAAAATLREALATALPKQVRERPVAGEMDKTQRAVFFQWLFLAANPSPPNADVLPPNRRKALERQRVLAGNAYRVETNAAWAAGRELKATFADVARVDASCCRDDGEGLLRDFFAAKLIGGRYLLGGARELSFAQAVPQLFLWYPMATWTAMALAADRGAAAASAADLREALRLLDPPLGQLTTEALPKPQRKACNWVFHETEIVVDASCELLGEVPA